jgi:DNA-binding response OmpR family regulator
MTSRKALIIDDEEDLCSLMKSFLAQKTYEVHTSLTLQEGLLLARQVDPDILFIDNNLPDGLGWEHIGFIQSILPSCRIVLMSAYNATVTLQVPGINASRVIIMEKPISFGALENLLAGTGEHGTHMSKESDHNP